MFYKKMFVGLTIALVFSFYITNAQCQSSGKEKNKTESRGMNQSKTHEMHKEKAAAEPWNEVCPVRGNKVQENSATVKYNGKEYAFCCPGCDSKFEKDPEKYSQNLSEDGKKFIGKK